MPLVNSPLLTPKKLAANRANAQLSRGPITLEGLIRMREGKIKHGAYSQDKEAALRVLGEDPKDFEALLESLLASWQPANALEELLVKRLARAIWRTERNDRLQESIAVRLVSEMTLHVDTMVANVCAQYDEKVEHLQWLLQSLADNQFVTRADDLHHFVAAYGESPQGRPREILVCLNLLVDPAEFGVDADAAPAGNSEEDSESEDSGDAGDGDENRAEDDADADDEPEAVRAAESKAQLDDPLLLPEVPVATGSKQRAKARKRAKSLLTEEIESVQAARDRDREELIRSNATYFRDSAIAKSKPESEVLMRREDLSFRQIGRITDLLLKLKREARQAQNDPMNIKNEGTSHDVIDNK